MGREPPGVATPRACVRESSYKPYEVPLTRRVAPGGLSAGEGEVLGNPSDVPLVSRSEYRALQARERTRREAKGGSANFPQSVSPGSRGPASAGPCRTLLRERPSGAAIRGHCKGGL